MNSKAKNVIFIFLGLSGLHIKRIYNGPFPEFVHSYLGNFSVSIAVYFLAVIFIEKFKMTRLFAAGAAFFAVQMYELTNGFGVMKNTFDPFDFLANLAGLAFAFSLDTILKQRVKK